MMRAIQMAVACVAVFVATAGQVHGGIIMNIFDDGTDLFMTATGSYDLSNATFIGSISLGANAAVAPTFPIFGWETFGGPYYSAVYSGILNGTADIFPATSVTTTTPFFFWQNNGAIAFQSGAPLSGSVNETATFAGSTLASLGMISGQSVNVSWGSGGVDEVGTIVTGQISAVPEPSSLALFGIGACVAGVGAARRRRREKQQEATA